MKLFVCSVLLAVCASSAAALTGHQSPRSGGVVLRASVPTGDVLDPGDRISLEYQTAQDAAVIVFDIDTQGYVRLISPGGELVRSRAHETNQVPDDGSDLVVEGEPGVEFLFAVAVDDPGAVDQTALASLADEGGTPRRIDGDPFIAANMIASELVQNVSRHAVFLGYTYFYVSERVEYPCYLCGTCDEGSTDTRCEGYRIVQDFDRRSALAYPLQRGYEMVELAQQGETEEPTPDSVALPDDDDDVVMNFYPYGSEVRYADPVAVNLWYDWGWYDPFFWYYPYCYPYSGWSLSIGFGWGWGWGWGWPGYYCSGWYHPYWGGCYYPYSRYYYPYNGSYAGTPPQKFKSRYKSGNAAPTLVANRAYAARRDGDLRVASKSVRPVATRPMSFRSKPVAGWSRSEPARRVKTSVSGPRGAFREGGSKGRAPAGYRSGGRTHTPPAYRTKGNVPRSGGRSMMQRNGTYRPSYRSRGSAVSPSREGGRRPSAPAPRMRPSGAPRSSAPAPSYRGGGSYRSGGVYRGGSGRSGGRVYRGGGAKNAPRGRGR